MATRMGGVVKALVEAFDGQTFLDLRLRENRTWSQRAGRPVPLWLMTSEATEGPTRAALEAAHAPAHVATFLQDLGLRLTREGALLRGDDGQPSTYSPGHGDLPDALRRSGLLSKFVQQAVSTCGLRTSTTWARASTRRSSGCSPETSKDVMVEVAPKEAGDKGGIPVWADAEDAAGKTERRLQVFEEFRLPAGFDAASVRVFNTNTFLVRAERAPAFAYPLDWFEVEKKVGRPHRRTIRAPPAGAHRRHARRLRPRPSRGGSRPLPPGEGSRGAGAVAATRSGPWRRRRGMT